MKVIFTGRIVRDAEVRHTTKGTAMVGFTVPDEVGYGDNKKTQWVNCSMFGKRAEGRLPEFLTKGQWVQVVGDLSINTYTTKEGENRTNLDVIVDDVKILWASKEETQTKATQTDDQTHELDDDIPF